MTGGGVMSPVFEAVPVDGVEVGDRVRGVDDAWVEVLAGMIVETGLQHPVEVIGHGDGYRLVTGAHRLAAVRRLGHETIEARVLDAASIPDAAALRIREIMNNISQRDLCVLDRAACLSELKTAHEQLHPETAHGKARKRELIETTKENKVVNFTTLRFSAEAARKTGFSESSIQKAVALHRNLTPQTRERLRGTALADHQSELTALSKLDADDQAGVLDLLLADEPVVRTVAAAHHLLHNIARVDDADDRAFTKMVTAYMRAPARVRRQFRQWLAERDGRD